MRLTSQQVLQFDEEGFVFLPEAFAPDEVALLRTEAEAIFHQQRPEVWREKSGAPRTAFAANTYNEAFRLLGAHPRLIRPVEQLFATGCTCISSRSMPSRRLPARSGSGTRITALGRATTACRSRGR